MLDLISVIIISKNAAKTLTECLNGLSHFSEVVLLIDESTTDSTREIAEQYSNVKIYTSPFIGFGEMKKKAESFATKNWILSIDCDEIVGPDLVKEIALIDFNTTNAVYFIHRKNHYRKTHINACGWNNDYVLRLYNKTHTGFNQNSIHEQVVVQTNSLKKTFRNSLMHFPFESAKELLQKMDSYSELYSDENYRKKRSSSFKAFYKGGFTFFKDYILRKGFLYGEKGFLIALSNANGAFYKYYKLKEKNEQLGVSLIISTYNRPDALGLVLNSVLMQSFHPLEIIIADDGSQEETLHLVESFKTKSSIPIKHVWQEDDGFQLARIRNKAIAAAGGDFISMIDGDIVLHKDFLKNIKSLVLKNSFYQGKRVLMGEVLTKECLQKNEIPSFMFFKSGYKSRLNTISFIGFSRFLSKKKSSIKAVKGCSMHFWKEDAFAVNGFNEDFVGWGREDTEFVSRLLNKGVIRRNIVLGSVGYHLYHNEASRQMLPSNDKILSDSIVEKKIWCDNGLTNHLKSSF